jgi:hypothetical protein
MRRSAGDWAFGFMQSSRAVIVSHVVYGILLGASFLGFAGGPWWVVPIGAGLLLLENRDFKTAGDRGLSSLVSRLARNIMFVSVSFALGLAAAMVFP